MMLLNRKRIMPQPVTVSDCLLLHQMGYEVEISGGTVLRVKKKKKAPKQIQSA